MAEKTRVLVRLDLGPEAPIEVLASAVRHLNTACQFGSELQARAARSEAIRRVLRGSAALFDDLAGELATYWSGRSTSYALRSALEGPSQLVLPQFEQAVATQARAVESDDDSEVCVERLLYENPLEALLLVGSGGLVLKLLTLIRDWSAERRIHQARADDIEDEVRAKKRLRAVLLNGIAAGQFPIRQDWLDELVSPDIVRAIDALSQANLHVEELPAPAPTPKPRRKVKKRAVAKRPVKRSAVRKRAPAKRPPEGSDD
jgi:hypothetical protein